METSEKLDSERLVLLRQNRSKSGRRRRRRRNCTVAHINQAEMIRARKSMCWSRMKETTTRVEVTT